MPEEATRFAVRSLEADVRRLWTTRRLPASGGTLGPSDGPIVHQFEGSFSPGDPPELVAHRAVVADVDARHLLLSGRGVVGTLRYEQRRTDAAPSRIGPVLESLGVWTGGASGRPWDAVDRQAGVQSIVTRLARREILAARDGPLRICLSCRVPRTPERIIYQKEVGDTLLVRFPIQGTDPEVDALVWVDAAWRLLGASALLVHPEVPYAVVEYRRKGASALLLASRGSLARLREWLPDVELAVKEERPGREWVGRSYTYPLRHEFPIGGSLDPPAGTIQSDPEVGDTGTGIVPLVPGHGPTDAEIADRLGIAGWPLLTPRGMLDPTLMHKYSGLDIETANEFVARDLTESGAVLARLRVVRGVPYCAICGHRMVWTPGRAWCLEPARLPAEQKDRYARLLPTDRPLGQIEVARWPVSETVASTDPESVTLLECARCERLDAPDGPPECPCGGTRRAVSRRLLPAIAGAFGAWARSDPLPPADSVRVYANERRRVPALVHHLAAMSGIDATGTEFGLTLVPTVNRVDLAQLVGAHGADAVRSALVRTSGAGSSSATFEERCAQEEARLERLYVQTVALLAQTPPELLRDGAQVPDANARDLEVEDRAILARWARTHLRVLASYDRWQPEAAHRQLFRFLERDLLRYLEVTGPRLEYAGTPATKRGALRTQIYLLRAAAIALAPIAPFTAEWVHRRLAAEARSLFEGNDLGADRTLADDELAAAWDRWLAVIDAADGFRRARSIPPTTALPLVALVLPDEEVAAKLRADRATLERLARIGKLEVTSPKVPWSARQRRLVPVEREIQRAYPSLASQIIHLLERMPPRRTSEDAAREVTVFVHGVPRTITPEMVAAVDTLPEGFSPTPYALGEMYVQVPGPAEGRAAPPPLSPDAFWLVRRVRRRLASAPAPPEGEARVAIVAALDPLATEIAEKAGLIATYLGLREFRVVNAPPEAAPHATLAGRTRTGARWTVALPGVPGHRRAAKHRPVRSDGRRVPPPTEGLAPSETDYADEAVIAHEEAIRDLGRQLDELFAAPLMGPAKVAIAWDAGFRSVEGFRDAPFEQVAALAGFGRPITATLWEKLGRSAPSAEPRARRAPRPAGAARIAASSSARPVGIPASVVPAPRESAPPPAEPVAEAITPVPTPSEELEVPSAPPPEPAPAEETPSDVPPAAIALPVTSSEPIVAEATAPSALIDEGPVPPSASETDERRGPVGEGAEGPATELPLAEDMPAEPEDRGAAPAEPSGPITEPAVTALAVAEALVPSPPDLPLEPPDEPAAQIPSTDDSTPGVEALPDRTEAAPESTEVAPVASSIEPPPAEPPSSEVMPATPTPDLASADGTVDESTGPIGEKGGAPPVPPSAELPLDTGIASPSELTTGPSAVEVPEVPAGPAAPEAAEEVTPPESTTPAPSDAGLSIPIPSEGPVDAASPPVVHDESTAEASIPSAELIPPVDAGPPAIPVETAESVAEPVVEAGGPEPLASSPALGAESTTEALPSVPAELTTAPLPEPSDPEPTAREPVPPEAGVSPPEPVVDSPAPLAPAAPAPEEAVRVEVVPAVSMPPPTLAVPVAPPAPAPEPPPPPAGVEIDFSSALFLALQPFLDATAAGHKGLALVRELPERIRVHIGPRPVEVFWLTNIPRPRTLRPTDLGALSQRLVQAMDEEGVSAIFLEGVEYLVGIHGVERVAAFLSEIDAAARQRVARIWVHITPTLLAESALDRLLAAVGPRPDPAS